MAYNFKTTKTEVQQKKSKDIFFSKSSKMFRRKKKKTSFQDDPRPLCNFTFVIRNATNLPNTDASDLSASAKNVADPYCTFSRFESRRRRSRVFEFYFQAFELFSQHHDQSYTLINSP